MKPILYGIKYVIQRLIFKADVPLICGLVLTNKCNLHCRHCRVADRGAQDLCFEEITKVIDSFYRDGGRCLYLEGGEPFLWQDGQHGIEDIVEYAHGIPIGSGLSPESRPTEKTGSASGSSIPSSLARRYSA